MEKTYQNKKKLIIIITACAIAVIAAAVALTITVIIPASKYNNAISLMEAEKYEKAIDAFKELNGYKDSAKKIEECNSLLAEEKYISATKKISQGDYEQAIPILEALGEYKDSPAKLEECRNAICEMRYQEAVSLVQQKEYDKAYTKFSELGDYKDSAKKANEAKHLHNMTSLKAAQIGDLVTLGIYEQDNEIKNGKEDIMWKVLDIQDGKKLLISLHVLDWMAYNDQQTDITWEQSTIRRWLNKDFISGAFNEYEKTVISVTSIVTPGSKQTEDKVFLLSVKEAETYFPFNLDRMCKASWWAISNGANSAVTTGAAHWWLRNMGTQKKYTRFADNQGGINADGMLVNRALGVRPAIWVTIEE